MARDNQEASIDIVPVAAESRIGGWGAVLSLAFCVATVIASEFMPVSLLSPIASDLRLTEGQAGQAIAVFGIFAVLTSLFISSATQRVDRRTLLLALTVIMLVVPACWSGRPAVIATKSPRFTNPSFSAFLWASRNIASVL